MKRTFILHFNIFALTCNTASKSGNCTVGKDSLELQDFYGEDLTSGSASLDLNSNLMHGFCHFLEEQAYKIMLDFHAEQHGKTVHEALNQDHSLMQNIRKETDPILPCYVPARGWTFWYRFDDMLHIMRLAKLWTIYPAVVLRICILFCTGNPIRRSVSMVEFVWKAVLENLLAYCMGVLCMESCTRIFVSFLDFATLILQLHSLKKQPFMTQIQTIYIKIHFQDENNIFIRWRATLLRLSH